MQRVAITTAILFVLSGCSMTPEQQAAFQLNAQESSRPGSTAIGQPVGVLAAWGPPNESAQLGDVTIHRWLFVREPMTGPHYSGTVSRDGRVSVSQWKQPVTGCAITVNTDARGTITHVSKTMLGGYYCNVPRWR